MKGLRALGLLLESIICLTALSVQEKIRKVKATMIKQKNKPSQAPSPSPSQAPTLKINVGSEARAGRPIPSFPIQKKSGPKEIRSPDEKGSSIGTISSIEGEAQLATPSEIKTCSALLDIPFRAVHLAYKDVQPLTKEELEYMAEPLAEIFIELDWMDKIKGPYIKLGYGLSVAIVTRVRAHEKIKAEKKKEEAKAAPVDEKKKAGGVMEPGRS